MNRDEEIRALSQKAEEIGEAIVGMEEKLKGLTFNEETAPAKFMMERMIEELRRMKKNIEAMREIAVQSKSEGGTI